MIVRRAGPACPALAMQVLDGGSNSSAAVLGRYCGYRFPWSIQSSGKEVYIMLSGSGLQAGTISIAMSYDVISKCLMKWETRRVN